VLFLHRTRLCTRTYRVLKRAGALRGDADHPADPVQACVQMALFAGERTGDETPIKKVRHRLAVDVEGFNLDATTTIQGTDRTRMERLCRYLLRGPLALDRLTINDQGNAVYALRKPDRHGRTTLVMTPGQLMARLSALIPAPHLCLRREFGVLAPRSPLRRRVAPPTVLPPTSANGTATRTPWAQLLKRIFGGDPDRCPRCRGRMVVVAIVRDPKEARRSLEGTGQYADLPGNRKPP
jgi:hypothetical protein